MFTQIYSFFLNSSKLFKCDENENINFQKAQLYKVFLICIHKSQK